MESINTNNVGNLIYQAQQLHIMAIEYKELQSNWDRAQEDAKRPGKFQGNAYAAYFYNWFGNSDTVLTTEGENGYAEEMTIQDYDRAILRLPKSARWAFIEERNDGFISCEIVTTKKRFWELTRYYNRRQREWNKSNIDA